MNNTSLGIVALAFTQALSSKLPASAQPAPVTDDWREQYAYSVGVQAYIYAGPLLYLTQLRYKWTTDASSFPYTPLNHLYPFRNIADATYKDGGSPNNDTLYSWGFFDLSKEPVVLVHPDMGQRYFTFEMADMYSNNFGYVGKRATGSKAGAFLVAGPGWNGQKPNDVREVIHSPTPYVLVFGRTYVEGPDDVAAVNKLQDQYRVVPLSLWGKAGSTLPEDRDVWAKVAAAVKTSYFEMDRSRQLSELAHRLTAAMPLEKVSYSKDDPELAASRAKVEVEMLQADLAYRQALAQLRTLMGEQ